MTQERRNLVAWSALAGLLVFGTMCVPFFLSRVFVADDLGAFHLPIRDFYSRQLAASEPWDWMPTLYCGFYLTGEGQLGGYHPLHMMLYRMLPLGAAFNLELLLNYPFLAVGTYVFLRRLIARRDAAAFGALVFTFSSFNLLHFVHPNAVAVVAHLPWLLWAIDIACRSSNRRSKRLAQCAIALLMGSQLLLGYPQYVWFSLLCEAAYAGYCLRGNREWRRAAGVLASLAVGGLIGAVQLLPTVDALAESNRQAATADFRNSGSMPPLNLVQLVEPYLFQTRVIGQNTHELGMYIGTAPLVLCFWLLFGNASNVNRLPRTISRPAYFFAGIAVVALLYALGSHGPIYWLQAWLPLVNSFRFPCRGIVLFQLATAVLAAIAWARLTEMRWSRGSDLHTCDCNGNDLTAIATPASIAGKQLGSGLLIITIAIAVVSRVLWPDRVNSTLLLAASPLLIAVALALVNACVKGRRWAPIALILFTAVDLAMYGLSYAVLPGTADLNQYAATQHLPPRSRIARVVADNREDPALRAGNQILLAGYSRADGYAGLEPRSCFDVPNDVALRDANVGWVRSGSEWRHVTSPGERVRINDPTATLTVAIDTPGHLMLPIETSRPSCLTIAERFHSGWRAVLDGAEIPVIRSGSFMACQIPAGRHQLELTFTPSSLRFGRLLTLCGLGLTLSWAVFAMVTRRDKA